MPEQGLELKVVKLENSHVNLVEITKDLKREQADLYDLTHELNTNIALITQSLRELTQREDSRKAIGERVTLFIVGGFITAAVSWIIRGGLGA